MSAVARRLLCPRQEHFVSHFLRLLIILAACNMEPSDPVRAPSPHAPVTTPITAVSEQPHDRSVRMAGHFHDSVRLKDAVIAGELPEVHASARRLVERTDPYPDRWRPFVTSNVAFARAALAAKDLRVAALAAAGLARTCGDCHANLGAGPNFDPPHDVPGSAPHDRVQHMQRHQWAADRMWEALISRSEYAWMAGAVMLTDAPLHRDDLTQDVELPDEVLKLNDQVHALGVTASTTVAWDARAEVYGQFLTTCATCHKGGC
jgi:cytochrome c553